LCIAALIALDVTSALQQHSVSCLPLLDDKSALVDVLSENDLLLIPCSKVLLPARDRAALPQSPSLQIPITIRTPLRVLLQQRQSSSSSAAFQTCTPTDTLLSVVRKFSSSRALRLVCVEQQGSSKIVGLVSLTDLFKCVPLLYAVLFFP
jgi:CBS-domain-containing membrane protein